MMARLTIQQIKAQASVSEYRVAGQVEIPLWEIIERDNGEFLDLLSIALIGSELLMDIQYSLIGANTENETLIFSVEGDVTEHLNVYGDGDD
jgi:hypothetical protein